MYLLMYVVLMCACTISTFLLFLIWMGQTSSKKIKGKCFFSFKTISKFKCNKNSVVLLLRGTKIVVDPCMRAN